MFAKGNFMAQLSTRSTIHRRFCHFVPWIATDDDREDVIRRQSKEIRERICGQASRDGLTIKSTPNSGSFAKNTGLRRHLMGGSDVDGQDVDLVFVVKPVTKDQEKIDSLLDRFERYAKATYPQVARNPTKSSICLSFVSTRLAYDLVPMLATDRPDEQILLRANGEQRRTSVEKHTDFIRRRTNASNELKGRVLFNECVRLFKWWREFRQSDSKHLPDVATVVIDLICAKAFDACQVQTTYAETLAQWFSWAAHVARKRQSITFTDYVNPAQPSGNAGWVILDPVNASNNVVSSWTGWQIEEFTTWLEQGRDLMTSAIRYDLDGEDSESLRCLVQLFGTPFKHHCEADE
jgi:hypothetical protein